MARNTEAYCSCVGYRYGPNSVHGKYLFGVDCTFVGDGVYFITFTSDPESNMNGRGLPSEFMHIEMKGIFLPGKLSLMVAARLTVGRSGSHLVGAVG